MFYSRIVQNRFVLACLFLILLYILISFGGTFLLPHHPNAQSLTEANRGPSFAHWLGPTIWGGICWPEFWPESRYLIIAFCHAD